MCKILRSVLMFAFLPVAVIGQSNQTTYGITSADKGSNDWIALRTLNMRTGKLSQMVLNMNDKGLLKYERQATKRP